MLHAALSPDWCDQKVCSFSFFPFYVILNQWDKSNQTCQMYWCCFDPTGRQLQVYLAPWEFYILAILHSPNYPCCSLCSRRKAQIPSWVLTWGCHGPSPAVCCWWRWRISHLCPGRCQGWPACCASSPSGHSSQLHRHPWNTRHR